MSGKTHIWWQRWRRSWLIGFPCCLPSLGIRSSLSHVTSFQQGRLNIQAGGIFKFIFEKTSTPTQTIVRAHLGWFESRSHQNQYLIFIYINNFISFLPRQFATWTDLKHLDFIFIIINSTKLDQSLPNPELQVLIQLSREHDCLHLYMLIHYTGSGTRTHRVKGR